MVKILLADEQAIIRNGLKNIISEIVSESLIEEANDRQSAIRKIENENYDLIILEAKMPDTNPLELVTDILTKKPGVKLLIFSMQPEQVFAKQFLQLGAMGYVSKHSTELEIMGAIENVFNNKKYVSASVLEGLTHDEFDDSLGNPFARLSRRESQILMQLLREKTTIEISKILKLQPSTVGTFKSRILEKLNCHNIMELLSLAKVHHIEFT